LLAQLPADDPARAAGRVTNLVYMGMGEPLHNLAEVVRSIRILTDPHGFAISPRRITVSTAGMAPAIAKLADAGTRVNLAVSLNATTDAVRDELMPINKKWPIAALLEAVRRFPLERRRRVTFEYVLLAGVNDADADARRLPELLDGIPCKVNLIPWNPHDGAPYRRPSERTIERFQERLKKGGLAVYLRRPRGDDIDAACGQLAGRADPPIAIGKRNDAQERR
jgi:23S rRNA (adenine2503-C2)-methyltransferase